MPFFILSLIFQVALVMHIVKTGRNTMWIWIVMILPLAGAIAYLLIEVLPNMGQSNRGKKAAQKVSSVLHPNRNLNQALNKMQRSDTIENRMNVANELLNKHQFEEASQLFKQCLSGLYVNDPYIMLGLAKAQFGNKHLAEAKNTLENLIANNPNFKDSSGHLLFARCLEGLGQTAAAEHEYEALRQYYAGPEAKYRYAVFCIHNDKPDLAQEILNEILLDAKNGGHQYHTMHSEWVRQTQAKLAELKA